MSNPKQNSQNQHLNDEKNIEVSVIMGSDSDWSTMKYAAEILKQIGIKYEVKIISAHRTPERLYEFAKSAKARGIKLIIAGAGGAAHLPGMVAAITTVTVLAVPVESKFLTGLDSLLSIIQMPKGIPVATFTVGKSGAINAALFAAQMLANHDRDIDNKIQDWRKNQTARVANTIKQDKDNLNTDS